jgi:acyl-CoA dehydrogenase
VAGAGVRTARPLAVRVEEVAAIAAADARTLDERAQFPRRGLQAMRERGLLGLLVPERFGGPGADLRTVGAVAAAISGRCLSTGMVFAMHTQQVAALIAGATPTLAERLLPRVARGEVYLASVTSERGKGGHLMSAGHPLERLGDGYRVVRDAPIVTGVRCADGFLVTLRTDPDAPETSVTLVWVDRASAEVEISGTWDPMGMRGTESLAARIVGDVPADHLVGGAGGFRTLALHPLVTVGHIGWAACWLGAARGAFAGVVAMLRNPARRREFGVGEAHFGTRLARIRLLLDTTSALLSTVLDEVALIGTPAGPEPEDPALQMHVNGLKVAAAENSFAAVNLMIELLGLRHGYQRAADPPLERIFRDLRSASLNYADDRLLNANGWLAVLDREVHLAGATGFSDHWTTGDDDEHTGIE